MIETRKIASKEDFARIKASCRVVAKRFGYPEEADDFFSQVCVWFCSGVGAKSSFDHLFIDYLRKNYGRTGAGGRNERSRHHRFNGLLAPDGSLARREDGETGITPDLLVSPEPDDSGGASGGLRNAWQFAFLFGGREAEVFERHVLGGEDLIAIADDLGITGGRMSQVLGAMKKKMARLVDFKEAMERLEWDEGFGSYEVEWIRL
ncbi:hypothetical protein EBX31_01810 [bacterium]|nr:hypothetical protein [bacterium]